jgi:hypothetical protein
MPAFPEGFQFAEVMDLAGKGQGTDEGQQIHQPDAGDVARAKPAEPTIPDDLSWCVMMGGDESTEWDMDDFI